MKQMLRDYELSQDARNLFVDNMRVIDISKNHVQHSRTKHKNIRHHFIRESMEDKILSLEYIKTENQLAYILTKPLDVKWFQYLREAIGMCEIA